MKKKYLVSSIIALTILAATASVGSAVLAADSSSGTDSMLGKVKARFNQNLTDEQKIEMKTKMEAVKTALNAGDYEAWVKAEKAMNENSPMLKKITTAEQFKTYVESNKQKEADMAARQVKMDAVKTALTSGDYNAWVAAEKAVDEKCPLLDKINAGNFSKLVEANKLRQQADTIMKELGIDQMGDRGDKGGRGLGGPGPVTGGRHGEMMNSQSDNK
jgi:hypothetical protein